MNGVDEVFYHYSQMKSEIKYVIGDATRPEGEGNRIIAHVCNDRGGWGRGFVLALNARDKVPESAYRLWSAKHDRNPFELGKIQIVSFDPVHQKNVFVANMVAQHGYKDGPDGIPLSYVALATCLIKLQTIAKSMQPSATVHMPRIGCGLAGGHWALVSTLVQYYLVDHGVPVTVYDLPVHEESQEARMGCADDD